MKLFDLHCDTLYEMYKKQEGFLSNTCHISLDKAGDFEEYTQVMAIWSEHSLDEETAYLQYKRILDYSKKIMPDDCPDFRSILAVEGGELICGDVNRIDELYEDGVRIFTPVWKDVNRIGGAFNTDGGITAFGKEVIERCFDVGITVDLSHASDELFYDVLKLAEKRGKPVIASHSCSREVFFHKRNLTDDMARAISSTGGIIGVNLVDVHLGEASVSRFAEHVRHLVDVAGEDAVCMGCDLDGTDILPDGIENLSSLPLIYDFLCDNIYDSVLSDKIFYANAQNFFGGWIN